MTGAETELNGVDRLREIVARLRAPDGCPWDREQTHASLKGALIEECYEVLEAIDTGDDANLREELGDLLLHSVMHAQLADERGAFTFDEVAEEVCDKLVRRHPHVFGEVEAADSAAVLHQWEAIKRSEKSGRTSAIDGVPANLPALMHAQKIQKKAARVGFDWPSANPVYAKVAEELDEVKAAVASGDATAIEDEVGDLIFAAVNLARKLGIESETALLSATQKFAGRFRKVEELARDDGTPLEGMSEEELDVLWERAKAC